MSLHEAWRRIFRSTVKHKGNSTPLPSDSSPLCLRLSDTQVQHRGWQNSGRRYSLFRKYLCLFFWGKRPLKKPCEKNLLKKDFLKNFWKSFYLLFAKSEKWKMKKKKEKRFLEVNKKKIFGVPVKKIFFSALGQKWKMKNEKEKKKKIFGNE